LVERGGEQESRDCVCAETLKAEIKIAGFAWASVSVLANTNVTEKAGEELTSGILGFQGFTEVIQLGS
jgi:hypothetical protein